MQKTLNATAAYLQHIRRQNEQELSDRVHNSVARSKGVAKWKRVMSRAALLVNFGSVCKNSCT